MPDFISDNSAPPKDWDREVPKWRVTRPIRPSPNNRHRHEPPFSTIFENDVWQFADRNYAAGEEIFSLDWPHPSFRPLNHAACRVIDFFNARMKSRLPLRPWRNGRLHLDDGLTGRGPVLPLKTEGTAA
jgi:hypothetical protein